MLDEPGREIEKLDLVSGFTSDAAPFAPAARSAGS
jgi:hypothetical protein